MDVEYRLYDLRFVWDSSKAESNLRKHGLHFERACEVFFDPLVSYEIAGFDEDRIAALGADFDETLLLVVHLELDQERYRVISARYATGKEKRRYEKLA